MSIIFGTRKINSFMTSSALRELNQFHFELNPLLVLPLYLQFLPSARKPLINWKILKSEVHGSKTIGSRIINSGRMKNGVTERRSYFHWFQRIDCYRC